MLCGHSLANASAGKYRFVGEMTVNGVRRRYRSENTVTVGGSSDQSPVTVGTIGDHGLMPGDSAQVDASDYFRDPDGDDLRSQFFEHERRDRCRLRDRRDGDGGG